MEETRRYDDPVRTGAFVAMILGFIFFWPIGLAICLAMFCFKPRGSWSRMSYASWYDEASDEASSWWEQKRSSHRRSSHRSSCRSRRRHRSEHRSRNRNSGNTAFDSYREETLKRLEDEQEEFHGFLEKLRQAKDKSEFDQFMGERKNGSNGEPETPQE